MNYSKQREKILDVLANNAVHPTAETLLALLKANDSNIGFPSNLKSYTSGGASYSTSSDESTAAWKNTFGFEYTISLMKSNCFT